MHTGNTARQTPGSVPKKKKKFSSDSKKYLLEHNQCCILSPGTGPGRLSIRCQMVRMMDTGWMSGGSGYVSPSGGNQRVIWTFDVYPGITQDWRVQKFNFPLGI